MITEPNVEKLLQKSKNRYELVVAVARRGRQLVDGKERKVKTDETSPITISALEFEQDKYSIHRKEDMISVKKFRKKLIMF